MRKIYLTRDKIALVDDEDLARLMHWEWCAIPCTHSDNFYAKRRKSHQVRDMKWVGSSVAMHREIMGEFNPKIKIDHINGDTLDNQKHNLRRATNSQNTMNRGGNRKSTSRYKGVSYDTKGKCWRAQIGIDLKKTYLGSFEYEEEAALMYNMAAIEIHGEFSWLNEL